jgi:hypothetical protein
MKKIMSLSARREMLAGVADAYNKAGKTEKTKILDGFAAATGYDRKYAIQLMSKKILFPSIEHIRKRPWAQVYDEQFIHVITIIWNTANQICSKRLVPFIPNLVSAMERHGHLRITQEIRDKLLKVSPATVDRLLHNERLHHTGGVSHTKTGALLKNQIQVRTFADWDDVSPGFFEVDLVAHCGGDPNGAFLNTLTMVDVTTGWLECMPLIKKSASDVITGINVARKLIPFDLKGLDTDGGSEFINHELLDYCEKNEITFTRARTHKKNDQAFVEEKNGSVVRRLVGYNRYQGLKAWEALANFYSVLRQYINFFQPSLKLLKKTREGGRVSKQYDVALTPYQRLVKTGLVSSTTIEKLELEYLALDPVNLMEELKRLQQNLIQFAWHLNSKSHDISDSACTKKSTEQKVAMDVGTTIDYFNYKKPKDKRSLPRTYRTRPNPFENVWDEIQLKLELQPESYAREIIEWLSAKYPGKFSNGQIRTLQRRIHDWRLHSKDYEAKMSDLMS